MRGLAEWALIRASKKGSRRMVKFFLPAAQSPESRMLALHAAVENNKIGAAEILLNANAPIDARNEDGFAAIHFAANETNQHMIQLLLDNNAFVDLSTTEYGDTALHLVARTRHTNISNNFQRLAASTLVSGGANINAQNIQRHTPLHLAIYHEGTDVASPNGSVARFLVESDANMFLVNNFNHTPLSWAQLHLVEALIPFLQVSESAKRTPMDLDA